MNQMTIMGHLGVDPEVRFTSSGQKVTTLRLACNQKKGGKEETLWWRVTLWGEQFDKLMPYVKKGSALIVSGEMLKPEIYNDREGNPQVSLNLVAYNLSFPPFGRSADRPSEGTAISENSQPSMQNVQYAQQSQQQVEPGKGGAPSDTSHSFSEDEIPF